MHGKRGEVKRHDWPLLTALFVLGLCSGNAVANPIFQLNFVDGTPDVAKVDFWKATEVISRHFRDDVTITLTVGLSPLDPGIIGVAGSTRGVAQYSTLRTAFTNDATSDTDATVLANLQPGTTYNMLINRTSDNPNGPGSEIPYLDDDGGFNNFFMRPTTANLRALDIPIISIGTVNGCIGQCDGFIAFADDFSWDFDRSDGIDAGAVDFIGVALHEIAHAMGFTSGVNVLDANAPPIRGPFADNQFTFFAPFDLFRYSAESAALGVFDWTADMRDKFFSLDGGFTVGPLLSTGINFGDGWSMSHWKDNLDIGLMDPTAARGRVINFSQWDLIALDAIGWDLIPEPASITLFGLGLLAIGAARRKRQA